MKSGKTQNVNTAKCRSCHAKQWPRLISPLKFIRSCCKNANIGYVTLLLNITIVTLLFWQSSSFHDAKDPTKHFTGKNYLCKGKICGRCERILKSDYTNVYDIGRNLCQEENSETENSNDGIDYQAIVETLEENEAQHANQLRELTERIIKAWTVTYTNMLKEFIALKNENNINHQWSRKIWYERWHKHIFRVLDEIDTIILDDTYSLYTKEYYSYLHLNDATNYFRLFLDAVKREWEEINEHQLVNQVA
ncbi:Protein of unknown function (Wx5_PLAF3D7), putative [Plasmodium ovale]|uniref:Uncharacterized protein n=1 Tax=Plasmodium ovale TaxID=36330 RepID=A0A1C3KKW6_PLAOA|nr:Protein of unknown function (Wx5_PLAF3D7), putative [Plasmodium ovale]